MSRLNYNKWDALELSDDSDIEVHPNVDKKSMIRWKQRDIHEKREARKHKLAQLSIESTLNDRLLPRLNSLILSTSQSPQFLRTEILRLRSKLPNFDTPLPKDVQPSDDHMILALLEQVRGAVVETEGKKEEKVVLEEHRDRLVKRSEEIKKEIQVEETEQKKLITSDDLHVGFDSKTMISSTPSVIPQGPTPSSTSSTTDSKKSKKTKTVQETSIETLNSPSTSLTTTLPPPSPPSSSSDSSDEESDVPLLTPDAAQFATLPTLNFEQSYKFISAHPSLLTEETTDALLVEAFSKAMKGDDRAAEGCVEKSLMIQYSLKLGRDGVSLFFRRMSNEDPRALQVFLEDLKSTQKRIIDRAHVLAREKKEKEKNGGTEQIQLVPTDEGMKISFDVPDGEPPEVIELTGEGSDQLDPLVVRAFLLRRWEIFQSFPPNLQKALKKNSLEAVNKVLGKMAVEEAEEVVGLLNEGSILNFDEERGIVDQTKGEEV